MKTIFPSGTLSITAAPAAAITVIKASLFAGVLMTFAPGVVLALQLSFCFEVRTLSDRLVSSAP